jgi:hypothetical protein
VSTIAVFFPPIVPNPELDGNEVVHLVTRNLCRQLACHGQLRLIAPESFTGATLLVPMRAEHSYDAAARRAMDAAADDLTRILADALEECTH